MSMKNHPEGYLWRSIAPVAILPALFGIAVFLLHAPSGSAGTGDCVPLTLIDHTYFECQLSNVAVLPALGALLFLVCIPLTFFVFSYAMFKLLTVVLQLHQACISAEEDLPPR